MVRLVSRFRTVCNNPRITRILVRYYEVEILSPGSCAVGWALTDAGPDVTLGGDDTSWAYDGSRWIGFAKSFQLFQILFPPQRGKDLWRTPGDVREKVVGGRYHRRLPGHQWQDNWWVEAHRTMCKMCPDGNANDKLRDLSGSKRK